MNRKQHSKGHYTYYVFYKMSPTWHEYEDLGSVKKTSQGWGAMWCKTGENLGTFPLMRQAVDAIRSQYHKDLIEKSDRLIESMAS